MTKDKKALIFSPIGLSPPVATEFYRYVREDTNYYPYRIILVGTREDRVIGGMEIIKYAIKEIDKKADIWNIYLDYTDVADQESAKDFMRIIFENLVRGIQDNPDSEILINIAGGRKSMVVISTILSLFIRPSKVYHVINRNIQILNEKLEALESLIKKFGEVDEDTRKELFKRYYDEIMDLMYPPKEDISIIEIPLLPYPKKYSEVIVRILEKPRKLGELKNYMEYIDELLDSKLLKIERIGGIDYITPTEALEIYKNILVRI